MTLKICSHLSMKALKCKQKSVRVGIKDPGNTQAMMFGIICGFCLIFDRIGSMFFFAVFFFF